MKKPKMKYTVQRIDDDEKQPELEPMPMLEINTSAAMLAFFILICSCAFCVFLIAKIKGGAGTGTVIGCLILLAILIGAVGGIFATTIARFRKTGSKVKTILVLLLYIAAVVLGIAVGIYIPVMN